MTGQVASWLIAIPLFFLVYSYFLYPVGLWVATRLRAQPPEPADPVEWPSVTVTVPCYNEERSIAATIESLLALDYPRERLHILAVSDASTDRTDQIITSFAPRGVELLRLSVRGGKTAAENAASARLRGEIVVNTDATTRILHGSLKRLVRVFQDPTIGVATGHAMSVGNLDSAMNRGEARYTSYEMWVRSLETRAGSIVGASGCFFGSRRGLYASAFPEGLSRDFASCLIAKEHGYRAVSVPEARCLVPLSSSVKNEFRRKTRTMARGLETLWYKRHLLNPVRYGAFSIMLFSHKLARWCFQLTFPLAGVGLMLLVARWGSGEVLLIGVAAALGGIAAATMAWPPDQPMPKVLAVPGYLIWANVAGMLAWLRFFRRQRNPIWEPTRRPELTTD